jgi:serine/threonine-protein kinase
MLVSWSRLLEGRWRDPLIGRDLLIGSAIGMATDLPRRMYESLTVSPPAPQFARDAWMGLWHLVARLPDRLSSELWLAFGMLLLLVGLRIVLRKERLAILAFVGVFGVLEALDAPAGQSLVANALGILGVIATVLVATRFGLLALLTMGIVGGLLFLSGPSLTPAAPLAGTTLLGIVLALAPGVFGFFTSRPRGASASVKWLDE